MTDLARSDALRARAALADATVSPDGWILHRDRVVEGAYPMFVATARGAELVDVDHNRYLDFLLGSGAVILGHADPRVTEAAIRELRDGSVVGLRKPVEVRLAELLLEVVPGAERVLLLKTGSDATSAAVRLARAYTGREHIARWGYNGWHDWAAWQPAGVPEAERRLVHKLPYNDIDGTRRLFADHGHEIACCLMMPFELELPAPGFLPLVADLCRHHGALFILDEMRSGFRVALGGAQEMLGVRADLVAVGKALGNGFPISAVVGARRVLGLLDRVHIGSTYFLGAAEMAAAETTIQILRDEPVLERVLSLGERFGDGLRSIVEASGVRAEVVGVAQMPFLRFTDPEPATLDRQRDAFFGAAARGGVLLHPHQHWYVSGAHHAAAIDHALAVCSDAMAVATAVDSAPQQNG